MYRTTVKHVLRKSFDLNYLRKMCGTWDDARTTNPKTRTEGRRPKQLTNQFRTAIRVQGEGLSFVTKIQPTEVEGMTSLAPGLFDIAERVRSMFSHACA